MSNKYGGDVNLDSMRHEVVSVLEGHQLKVDQTEGDRGAKYAVSTNEADFEITLSDNWIGYDLNIKKEVFGRSIGVAEDTDNYPLKGEPYARIASEIYEDAILCLRALVEGRIRAGKVGRKVCLVIPKREGLYKVINFGRIMSRTQELTAEAADQIGGLRPVA